MSNNIYDIMKKLNAVEGIDKVAETQPKNSTLLEATMQEVLSEKYMGFKAVAASAKKGGAKDPEAVAASIGRKKYGKEKFQKAAAAGKKLGENAKLSERTWTDPETGEMHGSFASGIRQANQQPYVKTDTNVMNNALRQNQPYVKTDTNVMNNALRQSSMNKLANMAAQDSQMRAKELSVKEDDMEEGNLFTGNLAKARAAGKKRADLDGDGDMETVKEQGVAEAAKYRDPKYLGKLHAPDAERQEREREEDDAFNAWVNSTDDFIDPVFQPDIRSHDEKVPLNRQGKPYEKDPLASRKDVRGRKDKTGVKRPFKADLKAAIRQGLGKHNLKGVLPEQGVAEGSMPMPKLPRRHFFDTWGEKGNGIAYTDNTHWWKIINGKIVDFTNSYEGTKEWKREFVARQKQGVAEGEKTMSRAAKGHEKYGKAGMAELAKAGRDGASEEKLDKIRDKHNKYDEGVTEGTKKTSTGRVHTSEPGGYGRKDDEDEDKKKDKKAEPAVKRGRGRPKKNADSDTGEVKKWDTSALQSAFGSSAPKKLPGKASVKHKMKDDDKDDKLDEVAPPGKKAERMVKNIKKGYAKDGKLTDKEKGIAYATTWKAHNKGKVEESIPPGFPKSLAKKIYEQCDGDMKNTLSTMWKVYNSVMESKKSSKKKISEGMKFEQSTTKPAMGTYKGGLWTADPPKKGEVGAPVPSPDEGAPVKQQSKRRPQKEDVSENKELNDVLKLAGMVDESVKVDECGMSPISGAYGDTMQDTEGRMSINTNMSTDGNKTVTITADGDSAVELMQMLKMAGLSANSGEDTDIEKMSEEKDDRYEANTTPEEEVLPLQTQLKGGNGEVAGKEKKMTPHGYKFADNPMAMSESMTLKLMKEYESIKKTK